MKCPGCGNEEHPRTALFCVKCGTCIRPERETHFIDREPGTGEPPRGPWR